MKTIELINDTYDELRREMGPVYRSKMEGYGVLVSRLNTLLAYVKDTKKEIGKFGEIVKHTAPEAQKEALLSIVNDAARVTAEAAAMAASVKVFIDTMIAQGGGDLIDMMEEDFADE